MIRLAARSAAVTYLALLAAGAGYLFGRRDRMRDLKAHAAALDAWLKYDDALDVYGTDDDD